MRKLRLTPTALAATVFVIVGALAPETVAAQSQLAQAQPSAPPPAQAPAPAAAVPKPYKAVAVKLPEPVKDASFDAFRKQLATIAQKKDRAGLARLVAKNFFWIPEDKDAADKKKSGIENLAKALGLDGKDAPGWELLAGYADDPTADKDPDRPGVICGPGDPTFDEKAAEELAGGTESDASDWGYPAINGIEVRSGPAKNAPVIEKLGLHLVRIYVDESPAGAVNADALRIVTPSGKVGFVPAETILPLASDHLCYIKEGNAWKIVGVLGGST
jgi:hypothetical protein